MKKIVLLVSALVSVVVAEDMPVAPAIVYTTSEDTSFGTVTRTYLRKGVAEKKLVGGVPVTRYPDAQYIGSHMTPRTDVASPRSGSGAWGDGTMPPNIQPVTVEKGPLPDPNPPVVYSSEPARHYTTSYPYSYYPYYHTSYGWGWYGGYRGGHVYGSRTYYGGSIGGGRTYYGGTGSHGGYVGGSHTVRGGHVGGGHQVQGGVPVRGGSIGGGVTYGGSRRH